MNYEDPEKTLQQMEELAEQLQKDHPEEWEDALIEESAYTVNRHRERELSSLARFLGVFDKSIRRQEGTLLEALKAKTTRAMAAQVAEKIRATEGNDQ